MEFYENRFFRLSDALEGDTTKLRMAVIPVEDAEYWNMVDAGLIYDEGEVAHFDTLYDEYRWSIEDNFMNVLANDPRAPVTFNKPLQLPRLLDGLTVYPTTFCHFDTEVYLGQYIEDHSPAIFGLIKDGEFAGQPAWTATVRLPGLPAGDGCVWIKTWDENDGLLDELIRVGLVSITGRAVEAQRGGVAIECRLLA